MTGPALSSRHGKWLAFLERAGLADRTARNWMQLARSGLGPANIVTAGGVRAEAEIEGETARLESVLAALTEGET